jgi:hypothetical protein
MTPTAIYNERIKLFATALNNTAVATWVTAIVAPVAGFLYGSPGLTSQWWPVVAVVWLFVGIVLHLAAQFILGRMRQ